jgi:hypothetical protein
MLFRQATGISNYSFHVLRGLLKQMSSYQFRGIVGAGWREITLTSRSTADQDERGEENSTSRSGNSFFRRIARFPIQLAVRFLDARPVRLLYRGTYRRGFAATVRSERLNFFYAFN